ncbi:hypothetical protein WH47_09606 [Habropoda laboriosa]|uniref:Uncharacterized protein n=1 Tax=Habropoda laboriosa TaxID=597456 RepID=A0A0L7RE00_9HYME|nr:hypothetical protein WH47_09606 [Habropoda laboriosa]
MPETAITPKSTSSLSASTSSKEELNQFLVEKGFTRCVQHKFLTYTQLPVRCQRPSRYYHPPRTSFRLTNLTKINRTSAINTAKSCPENSLCSIFHRINTPRYKKSLSMIDLTPLVMEAESGEQRSDSGSTLEKFDENDKIKDITTSEMGIGVGIKKWMDGFDVLESNEGCSRFCRDPTKAANLMCHVLMLNAWRQRRSEVQFLYGKIEDMSQQIEHLHLQIVVLRRLLDTENGRVSRLTGEVHRAKVQFDETFKERNTLRSRDDASIRARDTSFGSSNNIVTERIEFLAFLELNENTLLNKFNSVSRGYCITFVEKGNMEEEIKRLNELSEERLVVTENVRNELFTAQNQLRALDEQMSKDREKLLKLREDKRILLEKASHPNG